MRHLFLIILFLSLTGCYTIHFVKNDSSFPSQYTYSSWHHIGLFGLMEFSSPVNLRAVCGSQDKWNSVRVQTGLLQGLVRAIAFPIGGSYRLDTGGVRQEFPYTMSIGTFYSPEEVQISCQ